MRIRLRHKILLAPVIGSVFFAAYLTYSLSVSRQNAQRLALMRDALFPELEASTNSVNQLEKIIEGLNTAVAAGEKDQIEATGEIAKLIRDELDLIQKVDKERGPEVEKLKEEFDAYYRSASKLSLSMIGNPTPDLSAIKEMGTRLTAFRQHLEQFQKDCRTHFTESVDETRDSSTRSTRIGILVAVIALGASIGVAYLVAFSVTAKVRVVVASFREIAQGEGDLRKRIEAHSHDEIGDLVRWFNSFLGILQTDIGRVITSLRLLSDVTARMSASVAHADQTLHRQQVLAAQVTEEVTHMARRVDEMADNAASASSAAQTADESAREGLVFVDRVIKQANELARHASGATEILQRLEVDSKKITKVVDVIQDVSNHTDMLALNASIEAAHAGELGRGFAVVADEVSRMAGRTQESTVSITQIVNELQLTTAQVAEIITQSQEETSRTLEQAKGSGNMLHRISERVGAISRMNNAIAQATDDQRQTSRQIHQNMEELLQSSRETVEQSTQLGAISEEIRNLSEDLRAISDHFKT